MKKYKTKIFKDYDPNPCTTAEEQLAIFLNEHIKPHDEIVSISMTCNPNRSHSGQNQILLVWKTV